MFDLTKFPTVVFSSPRSGCTALANYLSIKHNLKFFNENVNSEFAKYASTNNDYLLKVMMEYVIDGRFSEDELPQWLKDRILSDNVFKIRISRNSLIDQVASKYVARERDQYMYHKYTVDVYRSYELFPIKIDLPYLINDLRDMRKCNIGLKYYNTNYDLDLVYENLPYFEEAECVKSLLPTNYNELKEEIANNLNRYNSRRILVMGLPGSGKTTLAKKLVDKLSQRFQVAYFNADEVRAKYNDWDFSLDGRRRQAIRMGELADSAVADISVCDFVAPTPEMRMLFSPEQVIWLDTIQSSRYENTNSIFVPPEKYDYRLTEQNADLWADKIAGHFK